MSNNYVLTPEQEKMLDELQKLGDSRNGYLKENENGVMCIEYTIGMAITKAELTVKKLNL